MNRADRRRAEREGSRPLVTAKEVVPDAPRKDEGDKVVVGWITTAWVDAAFTISIAQAMNHDAWQGVPLIAGVIGLESSPRLVEARTQVVEEFLTNPLLRNPRNDLPCEWLFMVDNDMRFDEDAIHRLVARAHEENLWVVGGLCFAGNRKQMYPTVYGETIEEDGSSSVVKMKEYPRDATVKVAATGAAFLLVHRDVLLKVRSAFGKLASGVDNPHPWFVEGIDANGNQWGEDIAFCRRVRAVGYDIWIDTRVKVGHMKRVELNEAMYDEARDREQVLTELDRLQGIVSNGHLMRAMGKDPVMTGLA